MCDRDRLTELQCYQILRVSRGSSFEDIRRAYIDLAWQCQQQLLAGNEESKKQAEGFFKSINRAYERLKSKFQVLNFTDGCKNERNIGVRKTNSEFWYQKGVLQDKLGGEEEAIKSFSQAIKLDCWYLEARFYRAIF